MPCTKRVCIQHAARCSCICFVTFFLTDSVSYRTLQQPPARIASGCRYLLRLRGNSFTKMIHFLVHIAILIFSNASPEQEKVLRHILCIFAAQEFYGQAQTFLGSRNKKFTRAWILNNSPHEDVLFGMTFAPFWDNPPPTFLFQIGRASCRERV